MLAMLGYSIHSALMGYVDGRDPKHLLGDGRLVRSRLDPGRPTRVAEYRA
jgi:hypothetical protein